MGPPNRHCLPLWVEGPAPRVHKALDPEASSRGSLLPLPLASVSVPMSVLVLVLVLVLMACSRVAGREGECSTRFKMERKTSDRHRPQAPLLRFKTQCNDTACQGAGWQPGHQSNQAIKHQLGWPAEGLPASPSWSQAAQSSCLCPSLP